MTPAAIIQKARAAGIDLALTPAGAIKATGDQAAVNLWLVVIREHKAGIIEVLKSVPPANEPFNTTPAKVSPANTAASWGWLVRYPDGGTIEVYTVPEEIDKEIARLKLASLGMKIDTLTTEQKKYLASWEMGT